MQSLNKKHISFALMFSLITLLAAGVFFTGCKDDDDDKGTQIWTVGPGNVNRGGVLKISGQDLGSISAVVLPSLDGSGIEVSSSEFQNVKDGYFEVKLPNDKNFVSGNILFKLSDGNTITSKVAIKVGALVLESFSPATAKPGQEITITGDYLSLVQSVVFASNQIVEKDAFKSQTNDQIVVVVPDAAQSGNIAVSYGEGSAYSDEKLDVTLPSSSSFESKAYKPGVDKITVSGKDMDLVRTVKLEGAEVTSFDSQSETAITFTVPATTKTGSVTVIPGSGINVPAGEIELLSPVINDVQYADGLDFYLLGETVTFTGNDLDLISSIKLGGVDVKAEDFKIAADNNSLTVTLAEDVKSNAVFTTANGTSVNKDIKIVPFLINGASEDTPEQVNVNCGEKTTITGKNLNYVKGISVHGFEATEIQANADGTSLTFYVVSQAAGVSGNWTNDGFTAQGSNGDEVKKQVWAGAPSKPYFLTLPKRAENGSSVFVSGANFNMIESIKIGDVAATYSVTDANNIFINIPAALAEGKYDIEITYSEGKTDKSFSINVASSVVILWQGEEKLGWDASKAGFFENVETGDLSEGEYVKIYMTQVSNDPAWSYLAFRVNQWTDDPNWPQVNLTQVAPGEEIVWSFKLTKDILSMLKTLYIYGEGNVAITKITYGEKE